MYATPEYAAAPYAYPAAYPAYEQEANNDWSDVAMLAVAGAVVGAAIGYTTKGKKASKCGNPYCTCGDACACGAGCQCGAPVSMLGVSGREGMTRGAFLENMRNVAFAGLA